jgi:mRNA-degrading endonuclease RelE of RelBE toxin-antitoxin system
MRIRLTDKAIKQYLALSPALQSKADKQFEFLCSNVRDPSLKAKKYQGVDGVWQGRIDRSWRFYFYIIEPNYIIISIINHPK